LSVVLDGRLVMIALATHVADRGMVPVVDGGVPGERLGATVRATSTDHTDAPVPTRDLPFIGT